MDVNSFDVRVCRSSSVLFEEKEVRSENLNPLLPPGAEYEYVTERRTVAGYEATLPHQCGDWIVMRGTKEQVTEALAALVIQLSEAMLRLHADDLDEERDEPQNCCYS